jgi:indole-3-glycerol phosphate synthase
MTTILDSVVASKRREIAAARQRLPENALAALLADAAPVRDFRAALERPGRVGILAEVKKASPSAGVLRADFDPACIARTYEQHGAACISVLTDGPFFQGSLDDLRAARAAVSLPVLRKDFLLDTYQVMEARCAGADAVLLIAEILDDAALRQLLKETHRLGMQALVELYEPENLQRVLASGAKLIGVNNRDLHTFVTRLEHTLELAPRVPSDCCLVSESGIRTHADIQRLQAAGVRAVLVGETLMRAPDIGRQLDALQGLGADPDLR